jgi:hypothetical protein
VNILRFEMNVPTEVALQSSAGVSVEGRYGNRVMFNLTDGRVMYVPPIVAGKIEAAGIVSGEPFQLCKALVKAGQRRSVEWLLDRTHPEPSRESAPEGIAAGASDTPLEHDLRRSIEMANANKAGLGPAICTCSEEIQRAPHSNGNVMSNGNGGTPALDPNVPSPPITKLEHALKTAISAAYNAEKFGSELGYVVRFDADAIKSMAITVLINMSERTAR